MSLALAEPGTAPTGDDGASTADLAVPRWVLAATAAAVTAGVEVSVATEAHLHFVLPLAGFTAALIVPAFFVHVLLGRWTWAAKGERLVTAVVLTLLVLMLAALADNTVLPVLGVNRPLGTWPVLITGDAVDLALGAAAYRRMPARLGIPRAWTISGWRGRACVLMAAVAVPMAAMGAVRLNNGAGAGLTLVALAVAMLAFAALFRWRNLLDPRVTPLVLYGLSLALLFMTSLRGWYTTGHDVQHEMMVFLRTATAGRWVPNVHDGYQSCLSITVLPTVLLRWTRVADPYVYKVFFQVLYALCPVIVYYVGRRVRSEAVGLISAMYFVGFVGFVQDMPMLNRQEIGFLFFGTSLLVLFMTERSRSWRWGMGSVLGAGMVLSHYSTTYYAIGALILALVLRSVLGRLMSRGLPWWRRPGAGPASRLIGWPLVSVLLAFTAIWQGPVNHDYGAVVSKVTHAVEGALGQRGQQHRGAAVGYSLAGPGRGATLHGALTGLLEAEAALRVSHPAAFIPSPPPSATLTPLVAPGAMPVTAAGRLLTGSQQGAVTLNHVWRTVAAWGIQVLAALGLAAAVLRRRYAATLAPDSVFLGMAMAVLLVAQVVLPSLSLDYGVSRSFMQALMILGPFLAIGSLTVAGWTLRRWRHGVAFGMSVAFFASTSGFVPQLTGGYAAQMDLNNSGIYYQRYYLHSQEVAGLKWLQTSVLATSRSYPDVQMSFDLFNQARSLGGIRAYDDIYPSDIRRDAYVVLGYPNVVNGQDEISFDGYQLWLKYPTSVLNGSKSLIYSNGATRIYR